MVADIMSRLVQNLTPDPDNVQDVMLATLTRLQIPKQYFEMIGKVHNKVVGHHGYECTLAKVLRLCSDTKVEPWEFIRHHVKQFIRQCPCCQKMSVLKLPIAAHPFTVSSYYPMDRLQMDFIGPFPDGQYILVIVCCFTRWTELFLCAQATAELAAQKLLEHIGRYGAPRQLLSDRGSHFVNEVVSELLKLIGVEHCLNIAYSKEESAIVERQNREVNRHLRAMFFHDGVITDYIKNIPLVQRILNASPHARTKIAPCQLLFGNMIDLESGIFLTKKELPSRAIPLSQHMTRLLTVQHELIQFAQKNVLAMDNAHYALAPAARTEFPVGSYVLLDYPDSPPTRLHTRKRGPFLVVNAIQNTYTLRDLINHKEFNVHITRLTPFEFDPLYTDPVQIAAKEQEEFFIEEIVAHRGNNNLKSTLEFRVRWLGFESSSDSWEPWKNLRDTKQLHAYLKAKGLARLIPKKFQ